MSRFKRFEIIEHSIFNPPSFPSFPILLEHELDHTLDLLAPPLWSDELEIQIEEFAPFRKTLTRRLTRKPDLGEIYLQKLCDRVSALESGLNKLAKDEKKKNKKKIEDNRKYIYTAEIQSPENNRKYKWTAEKKGSEKSYKWTAEIKGKEIEETYTVKVSSGEKAEEKKKTKKKECEKVKGKGKSTGAVARVVEIEEEPSDHGGIVLRQVFAKRVEKQKGKRKELSYQDAAALIQKTFRAYLIRRSQALRALRELAIAKTKLKEIRALFNNFTYRRRLARDAEEHQRFSEKIIVLLLTVDAIEGADLMVRAAKRSMVNELEAMLDVVDPQPPGKSLSMKRRTFDMPDGVINKELAAGVSHVIRMLDDEATSSETFEACL